MTDLLKKIDELQTYLRFKKSGQTTVKEMNQKMKDHQIYEGSDEEYRKVVLPFWEKYGMKPEKKWYQYNGLLEKKFDPCIIPDNFLYTDLYRFLNDIRYDQFLQNKLYLPIFLHDVKKPHTVIKHVSNFFVNDKDELITKQEAVDEAVKYGQLIIKPSSSSQGNGVKKLDFILDKNKALKDLDRYIDSGDFLLQEVLKQSEQMNSFNDTSINTIRIITLIVNNKVEILSSVLRVGSKGSLVDNYAFGGKSRPIDKETGYLRDFFFQREEMFTVDENGNPLKKEFLKGYDKAAKLTKLHSRFPHIRLIGWDFAIDENYEPVIIELNAYVGDNQREDGPAFGKFTETILNEYIDYKNKK